MSDTSELFPLYPRARVYYEALYIFASFEYLKEENAHVIQSESPSDDHIKLFYYLCITDLKMECNDVFDVSTLPIYNVFKNTFEKMIVN